VAGPIDQTSSARRREGGEKKKGKRLKVSKGIVFLTLGQSVRREPEEVAGQIERELPPNVKKASRGAKEKYLRGE